VALLLSLSASASSVLGRECVLFVGTQFSKLYTIRCLWAPKTELPTRERREDVHFYHLFLRLVQRNGPARVLLWFSGGQLFTESVLEL
jgi:hypothetical protein